MGRKLSTMCMSLVEVPKYTFNGHMFLLLLFLFSVFPVDGCMSSSYRLHQRGISTTVHGTGGSGTTVLSSTLTKRNSLGTSPYAITATATPSGAIQTQIHGSTSFSGQLMSLNFLSTLYSALIKARKIARVHFAFFRQTSISS